MEEFITIKTTREALKLLRIISAYTGEKQWEVMQRVLNIELNQLKTKQN